MKKSEKWRLLCLAAEAYTKTVRSENSYPLAVEDSLVGSLTFGLVARYGQGGIGLHFLLKQYCVCSEC